MKIFRVLAHQHLDNVSFTIVYIHSYTLNYVFGARSRCCSRAAYAIAIVSASGSTRRGSGGGCVHGRNVRCFFPSSYVGSRTISACLCCDTLMLGTTQSLGSHTSWCRASSKPINGHDPSLCHEAFSALTLCQSCGRTYDHPKGQATRPPGRWREADCSACIQCALYI